MAAKYKGRRGENIFVAFCGINARNSTFSIIKIDEVKFEPYFNWKQCGEKLVLDGSFDDNLPHKIATLSSQYPQKLGLPSWFLTSATKTRLHRFAFPAIVASKR